MAEAKQYKTHYLFLLIFATVSRVPSGMTVREIGEVLGYPPEIIAHCIALHQYLERQDRKAFRYRRLSPMWCPGQDIITRGMLAPPDQRRGAPHV